MGRGGLRAGKVLEHRGFGLSQEDLPRSVQSTSLFGNDRTLELEIGSGTGTLLVRESLARPEVNFVGVEHARRYWRLAADRLRRNECYNARVVNADATIFINEYVVDESLQAVHVYFPDPWPKRRHHRRRFVQEETIDLLARKMRCNARLSIITDHPEYYQHIKRVVEFSCLTEVAFEPPKSALPGEFVGTNFERKYKREKRIVYVIAAERS